MNRIVIANVQNRNVFKAIMRLLSASQPSIGAIEAVAKIFGAMESGKVFSVRFTKRTDGQDRLMRCRFGVKAHLKGGTTYKPHPKALFHVFDMDKRSYRSIPWEGIKELKIDGQKFLVG